MSGANGSTATIDLRGQIVGDYTHVKVSRRGFSAFWVLVAQSGTVWKQFVNHERLMVRAPQLGLNWGIP